MSALPRGLRVLRLRWRRSLQLRVVGTTLAVSAVVVAILASLLLDRVGRGLVDSKTSAALLEARSGAATAQAALDALPDGEPVRPGLLELVTLLNERGAAADLYDIALVTGDPGTGFLSFGLRSEQLPAAVTAGLTEGRTPLYVYADVPVQGGGLTDGIVVGSLVRAPSGDYRLYHLFPLTAEQQTLDLLLRTAAAAGVVLVALLALIAYLVARQVVAPVRLAAGTAEELAAGRLTERMQVRGEDELARLAISFNAMAGAIQDQIRQLEDLSRVQRRFVSDVSHELRTPLTTVRMAADVLHEAREGFPPGIARSAELLQTELERFETLLADLLEISRYDAGATLLEAERADVVSLVDRVVAQTSALASRRGSPVLVEVRGARQALAEVDAVRVERVLRNLLVNAVEHGEGGVVEVVVGSDALAVAVVVRDHGVGLQPGQAELVFTRFWRGDPSRARTTGGTGLGLAIALEDTRLHGGRLEAWGVPGGGAAFRMTLPRRAGGLLDGSPLALPPAPVTRRPPLPAAVP